MTTKYTKYTKEDGYHEVHEGRWLPRNTRKTRKKKMHYEIHENKIRENAMGID